MTASARPFGLSDEAVKAFVQQNQSDLYIINGGIGRGLDNEVIQHVHAKSKRNENATLVLVTGGGDADAAYRISRCFQTNYKKFTCIISGFCKSAGTIIAIGAHELVFAPSGELGPIDVQMSKKDELAARESGLTVMSALEALNSQLNIQLTSRLIELRNAGVPSKIAELAAKDTIVGTYAPIFAQINPSWVGEAARALYIGTEYGRRLNHHCRNLKMGALEHLTSGYSDHGFVIDLSEARNLFERVRVCQELEGIIVNDLGKAALIPMQAQGYGIFVEASDEEDFAVSNDAGNNKSGGENDSSEKTATA